MALLNLDKKKAEKKEESSSQESVPDELPSLPDSEDKPQEEEKKEEKKEVKEELPEIKEEEVKEEEKSNDEIIEINDDISVEEDKPEIKLAEKPKEKIAVPEPKKMPILSSTKTEAMPAGIDNKNLFFSDVLKELNNLSNSDSLKSKLLSEDIVVEMKRHFKEEKVHAEIDSLNNEIKEKVLPLQKKELEWQNLNKDINEKQKQLRNLEKEIETKTEELKSLVVKLSKMTKKSDEHSE